MDIENPSSNSSFKEEQNLAQTVKMASGSFCYGSEENQKACSRKGQRGPK
jgi:hypothetical protein